MHSQLPPWNRICRSIAGVLLLVLFVWGLTGDGPVGSSLGLAIVGFLGASFLLQSLMSSPGCEVTAIPNLLLRLFPQK